MRELAELWRDPVYYGVGVPRGDGRLVLVVPGLFGNDMYLQPLHTWLIRMGYAPVLSTISLNAGCPNRLREQVERELSRRMRWQSGPVALIGHSRGGMLSWAIAARLQEQVSHLALIGSPAAAIVRAYRETLDPLTAVPRPAGGSYVAEAGLQAQRLLDPNCNVPNCGCPYPEDIKRPLSPATRILSIYSRDDPIVSPQGCAVPEARNVEIGGTHSGLVYNRAVYPELARFLASK